MPRLPNKELAAFRYSRDETHATPRYECSYCGQTGAKSTSRQLQHLRECTQYLRHLHDIERGVERATDPRQLPGAGPLIVLPPEAIYQKNRNEALSVYMDARPFACFEDEYTRHCLMQGFQNYEPLRRDDLAGKWLDICYEEVYSEAQHIWKRAQYIHTIMDESTDIAGHRIITLSFVTPHGVFYVDTEDSGAEPQTSDYLARWFINHVEQVIGSDNWHRVNSLASTEACATMRSVWRKLQENEKTRHLFFVPCESHGLQLLIKDILETHPYSRILEKCLSVASFFHSAKKQYAILREEQQRLYGHHYAIVLFVVTRWGTQQALMSALRQNKSALQAYQRRADVDCPADIAAIICDSTFWSALNDLLTLIREISEGQKKSESSLEEHGGLAQVFDRWCALRNHLEISTATLTTFAHPTQHQAASSILPTFDKRRSMQLSTLHSVAYLLNPSHLSDNPFRSVTRSVSGLEITSQNEIVTFLEQMGSPEARIQFHEFRNMQGLFVPMNRVWDLKNSCIHFWTEAIQMAPELGWLALRIFHTPGNSVPSERSFSVRNLVHDTTRKRLSPEKANKLTFIHINRRVLDRANMGDASARNWHQCDDDMLLEEELSWLERFENGRVFSPDWFQNL